MNNRQGVWICVIVAGLVLLAACRSAEALTPTPLTEESIDALLAKLPPLAQPAASAPVPIDQGPAKPRLPDEAVPAYSEPTPPAATEQTEAPRVIRATPQGEVDRAQLIALSFSSPMVPLAEITELHPQSLPITLTPDVPGRWRWMDPRNLVFQPETDALPMATAFQVHVAQELAVEEGLPLEAAYEWRFATPSVQVNEFYPDAAKTIGNQPVLLLTFNQAVDTQNLLGYLSLESEGQLYHLKPASQSALEASPDNLLEKIEKLADDHWIAVVPTSPLPWNTAFTLTLDSGAPAQEGPRRTQAPQAYSFQTAGPLTLINACRDAVCRPDQVVRLELNHPLARDWDSSLLNIKPEVDDLQVNVFGESIHIRGNFAAQTDYQVALKAGSQDIFGRMLAEDLTTAVRIAAYEAEFYLPSDELITLPGANAELPIITRNIQTLDIELRRVTPKDWADFQRYRRHFSGRSDRRPPDKPGALIDKKTIQVDADPSEYKVNRIPLTQGLNDQGFGHLIVFVSSPDIETNERLFYQRRYSQGGEWVQVTDLALSAYVEHGQVLAWVTALKTGEPVSEARIGFSEESALTDDDGLATLSITTPEDRELFFISKGEDQAIFPAQSYGLGSLLNFGYLRYPTALFTDRQLYQPGELVNVKGLVRRVTEEGEKDLQYPSDITHLTWTTYDGWHEEIASGTETLSNTGSFHITFELPDHTNLGEGSVEIELFQADKEIDDYWGYTPIYIQSFRRPEYQVEVKASTHHHYPGEPLQVTTHASYYSGGPLSGAPVEWQASLEPTQYHPPGWPDYHFGAAQFIWQRSQYQPHSATRWFDLPTGQTDPHGKFTLLLAPNPEIDLSGLRFPHTLELTAEVTDINRQIWSDNVELTVHPGNVYVGVKINSRVIRTGEELSIHWVTVNQHGEAVTAGAPQLDVERLLWQEDQWQVDSSSPCPIQGDIAACVFTPETSGQYRITASILDKSQRESRTEQHFWVTGSAGSSTYSVSDQPSVQLIPDKDTYEPGDIAQILVQTNFSPAHTLLTIQRHGLTKVEYQQLSDGSYTFAVPIEEVDIPGVRVTAEAVGGERPAERSLADAAQTHVQLPVSREPRRLRVALKTGEQHYKPGEAVEVSVTVTDSREAPAEMAEVTLYAVDQSVLDMIGYSLPDPLNDMYAQVIAGVQHLRPRFDIPAVTEDIAQQRLPEIIVSWVRSSMRMLPDVRRAASSVDTLSKLRRNFSALATFESSVTLDDQGQAQVTFTLPDNLTRYRIMAVAHTEKQFGAGETQVDVGLPLMVRPSLPRFLNLGDQAELPVVVHNTTDQPLTADLALRASNLKLIGAHGQRLTIPANDRREVLFAAEPIGPGEAKVQVIVSAGDYEDAAEIVVPIQRPATREAFAQYGSLTEGNTFLQLATPADAYQNFGGLSLTTSSSQFQNLTDAFTYLLDYPYGCAEQLASKLIAVTALQDVAHAFDPDKLQNDKTLEERAKETLSRLTELQNADGGWSFWARGAPSQPYVSAHVTHALLRARNKNYEVPDSAIKPALDYLRDLGDKVPESMEPRARNSLNLYSFYVRAVAGESVAQQAIDYHQQADPDQFSVEALGWLLSVLDPTPSADALRADILRQLGNQLRETAAAASFVEQYGSGGHWVLHGSRRTDAVVLAALLENHPESDLIEKLARGLLQQRRQGHWGSTQENVFALLALTQYFSTRAAGTPDISARVWLGERFLGEHRFQGFSTSAHQQSVSMRELQQGEPDPTLVLQHEGQGRLYYRIGLEYAPHNLRLDASQRGFRVERRYKAINHPDDVRRTDNGLWEIKAGAPVRVKLTLTVPARRHHVALTDRLPAGFEALNPELRTSASGPLERRSARNPSVWKPQWYEHQQLRADRAEAFSTELEPGIYRYEYTALATTPGTFVAPPAYAEEMYHPETFGRTATETVRIVEGP